MCASLPSTPPLTTSAFANMVGADPAATFRPLDCIAPTATPTDEPAAFLLRAHENSPEAIREFRLDTDHGNYSRQFRMIEIIGRGGAGEVWSAYDSELNRIIAVKRPHDGDKPMSIRARNGIISMFQSEAHISARLDHPNIVPIYAWGVDHNRHPLMAMKLVAGTTWDKILHADRFLPLIARIRKHLPHLINVCQTVAFAHSRGIMHRDLKPQQVMIGEFGQLYLMDWGLAVKFASDQAIEKALKDGVPPAVEPDLLDAIPCPAGTACFMAPEQTTVSPYGLGPWTDVFELGGILYYLLTGQPPFFGKDRQASMIAASKGIICPPSPEAPAELAAIAMQALEPDRHNRHITAAGIATSLADFLQSLDQLESAENLRADAAMLLKEPPGETQSETYARIEKRVSLLRQARILAPNNTAAIQEHQSALRDIISISLQVGDFNVALHQIRELDSENDRQTFEQSVLTAQEEQARSRRQLRWTIAALTLALVLFVVASAMWQVYNSRLQALADQKTIDQLNQTQNELTTALSRADQQTAIAEASLRLNQLEQYASTVRLAGVSIETKNYADPLLGSRVALQPRGLRHFEWAYVHGHLTPSDASSQVSFQPEISAIAPLEKAEVVMVAHGDTITALDSSTLAVLAAITLPFQIKAIDSSPDERRIAVLDANGRVWIAPAGERFSLPDVASFRPTPVTAAAMIRFHRTLDELAAVRTNGIVDRIDASAGEVIASFGDPSNESLRQVIFNPQGTTLAVVHRDCINLYEWPDGRHVVAFRRAFMNRGPQAYFWAGQFHPDGKRFMVGNTFGADEIDFRNPIDHVVNPVLRSNGRITRALYDPSGDRAHLASDDRMISTYARTEPSETWQLLRASSGHRDPVEQIIRLSDGRLISHDGSVVITWSLNDKTRERQLHGNGEANRRAAFSPDGRALASISFKGDLRIWSNSDWAHNNQNTTHTPISSVATGLSPGMDISWSPDGRRLAATGGAHDKNILMIYSVDSDHRITGVQPYQFDSIGDHALGNSVEFSSDGGRLFGMMNCGTGYVLGFHDAGDVTKTTFTMEKEGDSMDARFLRPSPDGRLMACGTWGGVLHIYSTDNPGAGPLWRLFHKRSVNEARWSPDGSMLGVACFDGLVHVYDTRSWSVIRRMVGHRGRLRDLTFSPDGQRIVSCGSDGNFMVWNVQSGHSLLSIAATPYAWNAHFSKSGRELALTSGDPFIRVIQVRPWD